MDKNKKDTSSGVSPAISTAGLSTVLIYVAQSEWLGLTAEEASLASMTLPILTGAFVIAVYWIAIWLGFRNPAEITAERSLNKAIIDLKVELKEAKELDIDTKKIEKLLNEKIEARANIYPTKIK